MHGQNHIKFVQWTTAREEETISHVSAFRNHNSGIEGHISKGK